MYFVLLYHPNPNNIGTVMVDENDDVKFFPTADEARTVAQDQLLGSTFGFDVFEVGNGV